MKDKNEQTGASLRMHKNPERELKTDEDYSKWSKKCLKEADGFYEVVSRCMEMMFDEHQSALLTNVSFSCELYLKYLLLSNKVDCRGEHNLYKLYKSLPERERNELQNKHPQGNIQSGDFERTMVDIGQSYMVFRYRYERGDLAFNLQFLMELLCTLNKLAHSKED